MCYSAKPLDKNKCPAEKIFYHIFLKLLANVSAFGFIINIAEAFINAKENNNQFAPYPPENISKDNDEQSSHKTTWHKTTATITSITSTAASAEHSYKAAYCNESCNNHVHNLNHF